MPRPDVGSRYPGVTCHDAVHVQRRMLRALWEVERLALVYWSMGAMRIEGQVRALLAR